MRILTQARKVPLTRGRFQQRNLRLFQGEISHVNRLRQNQRHNLHAHLQRFGEDERIFAESWIVCDREILRSHASGENRKTQVADFYLASQSGR